MVSLTLQKRLASDILRCGKKKIWLDPNELTEISMANSRQNVRRLIKAGFVIRKPQKIHSRARIRKYIEAKKKGRHTGIGKRRGTKEARTPSKRVWIRRIRVFRLLLKRLRNKGTIDPATHCMFYLKAKGNMYRNKRVLIEAIQKHKLEKKREEEIKEQIEAKKSKKKAASSSAKREERKSERKSEKKVTFDI